VVCCLGKGGGFVGLGRFVEGLLREICVAGFVADTIRPQDLGLTVQFDQQSRGDRGFGDDGQANWRSILPIYAPPISYLHLYECDLFSVSVGTGPVVESVALFHLVLLSAYDHWSRFEAWVTCSMTEGWICILERGTFCIFFVLKSPNLELILLVGSLCF
jgi:hypothetical protein